MSRAQAKPEPRRLPVTKARVNLGAVLRHVHEDKVPIILERNGEPIAVILDVDQFEDSAELHDPAVNAAIAESRRQYEAGKGRPIEEFFAELEKELVKA
jgi:prevent-host-death family protein